MPSAIWESCPPNKSTSEYIGDLMDRRYEREQDCQFALPVTVGVVDHTRLDHIKLEATQRQRARRNAPHLELDALCLTAQLKHADAFWRHVLTEKLNSLFSLYEKARDYDRTDDHENKCRQLTEAKRKAGYHVHSAR